MNWHLTLENFIIFLGFVSILSFVFLPEFVINIILSRSICTVWDTTDMAGRGPTIFNCSSLFLLFSVHFCQRTIVSQEQHPALKLGVFLLILNCSLLFVFPVKKKTIFTREQHPTLTSHLFSLLASDVSRKVLEKNFWFQP